MTKDDVTGLYIWKVLASRCCKFCRPNKAIQWMDDGYCSGCIAKEAWLRVCWLESQRQQTARERQDALDT